MGAAPVCMMPPAYDGLCVTGSPTRKCCASTLRCRRTLEMAARRGSGLPGAPRSGAVSSISIAGPSTRLPPMLIVLSGLPGTGKTTIAREVARAIAAVYLRIDSIEQVMAAAGWRVEGEGYAVAQAVADDNLRLGRLVVADCVNPWPLTREAWRSVAERAGVETLDVEIVCSDAAVHRRRVDGRAADIPG